MAWTTPKTDWKVTITDGVYTGDYFNYTDYNRIKNNIVYLASLPLPNVDIYDMGGDKALGDMVYYYEFNDFQDNLRMIGQSAGVAYENYRSFSANGNTPTFEDLNQIESFCLTLYEVLNGGLVYAVDTDNLLAEDTEGELAVAEDD